MRNPFAAFADPARRPRAIVWTGFALVIAFTIYGVSMTAPSTTRFCNNMCHNVHPDNAKPYFACSHSEVSCIACHYPPALDPVRMALDRVDKLLDIYPTVTNTFEMPLNKYSRIALETPSDQCTQCHGPHREVSPSHGRKIDHEVHAAQEINCTVCHNRMAHPEKFDLTLPGNEKHEDFMTMRGCFRCHVLSGKSPSEFTAPGTCPTCHKPEFELKPADHTAMWSRAFGGGLHITAAKQEASAVTAAKAEWEPINAEFVDEEPGFIAQLIDVDTERPVDLPPLATIDRCNMCHDAATFCEPCHAKKRTVPLGQ